MVSGLTNVIQDRPFLMNNQTNKDLRISAHTAPASTAVEDPWQWNCLLSEGVGLDMGKLFRSCRFLDSSGVNSAQESSGPTLSIRESGVGAVAGQGGTEDALLHGSFSAEIYLDLRNFSRHWSEAAFVEWV